MKYCIHQYHNCNLPLLIGENLGTVSGDVFESKLRIVGKISLFSIAA